MPKELKEKQAKRIKESVQENNNYIKHKNKSEKTKKKFRFNKIKITILKKNTPKSCVQAENIPEVKQPLQVNISRKLARIIGAVVLTLAIIGIIGMGLFVKTTISNVKQKEKEQQMSRIEKFISPVVAINPKTFNNIKNISNDTMIKSAAVYVIENYNSDLKENFEGKMILPTDLLDKAVDTLYGKESTLKYVTFDINEVLFEYDSEKSQYYFAATGNIKSYQPKILEYSKVDGVITVLVEYEPYSAYYNTEEKMQYYYKLEGESGKERLVSISSIIS